MSAQSGEVPAEAIKAQWQLNALWEWRREISEDFRALIDKMATLLHMRSERGPRDHELSDHDIARRVARIIAHEYGPRHVTLNNGDNSGEPRPSNGEKRLLTWILGVLALLLVGGTGGVIVMYGKLSSIEKGQEGHEQRITRLEADRDRAQSRPP